MSERDRQDLATTAGLRLQLYRRAQPHPTEARPLYQDDVVEGAPSGLDRRRLSYMESGRTPYQVNSEVVQYLADLYGHDVDEIHQLIVLTYTPELVERLREDSADLEVLERAIQRFGDEEAA